MLGGSEPGTGDRIRTLPPISAAAPRVPAMKHRGRGSPGAGGRSRAWSGAAFRRAGDPEGQDLPPASAARPPVQESSGGATYSTSRPRPPLPILESRGRGAELERPGAPEPEGGSAMLLGGGSRWSGPLTPPPQPPVPVAESRGRGAGSGGEGGDRQQDLPDGLPAL